MSHLGRFYLLTTVFLAVAVVVGGVMLGAQHGRNRPTEIVLHRVEPLPQSGQVHVNGAVVNPGIYPLREGDTVLDLLRHAGLDPDADLHHIELRVPHQGEAERRQRIDINRAETWLLEALPGIGEVRAQAIVGYREEHGPFRRIEDLLKVSGIGPSTLERIQDYITVAD